MHSEQDPAVANVEGLLKRYGKTTVLDGIDFTIRPNEVCGFLGRNGAGKSTAIRILMGIVKADAGSIEIFGQPLKSNVLQLRQRIGYVAQEQNFYPWMTPTSIGRFVSGLYQRWNQSRYEGLIDQFELPWDRKVEAFSGGMKAKLALALALGSEPELLLLDEPTAGMDPVVRREFLQIVKERTRDEGMTTFFSTHLISDVESIAKRVCILDNHKVIYEGGMSNLANSMTMVVAPLSFESVSPFPQPAVQRVAVIKEEAIDGQRRQVLAMDPRSKILNYLQPPWEVLPMSLEDVFVTMVGSGSTLDGLTSASFTASAGA